MTSWTTSSIKSVLPLDIRLRALEAQIFGVRSTLSDPWTLLDADGKRQRDPRSLTSRVRELHEGLERISADSEGLKRLLAGCQLEPPSSFM